MDLRSIINTEAGDSPITKQAAPGTPEQSRTVPVYQSYNHPPQYTPDKYSSQDHGIHQSSTPTRTYPQNFHSRRRPPPIQASPQHDFRSPAQPLSALSPYPTTPSSATSQYPFPPNPQPTLIHNRQLSPSPAQSHQYTAAPQYIEIFHNPHISKTHHYSNFGQASLAPQISDITSEVARPYLQHQQSQSSILSSVLPISNEHKDSKEYSQDISISGDISSSHPQQLQCRPPQPTTSSNYQLQREPTVNIRQPINTSSQKQKLSPTLLVTAGSTQTLGQLPNQDTNIITLTERHRRSQITRERSISVSPKTCVADIYKEDIRPQEETDHLNITGYDMREVPVKNFETTGLEQHGLQTELKDISANGARDVQMQSTLSTNIPRKRTRYKEVPIWARSIREKGAISLINRKSVNVNYKQSENQPSSVLLSSAKAQMNENQSAVTHSRATTIDSNPSMILKNWQESITGKKPIEHMTKLVADFFFLNVVSRNDLRELSSRGVQIEIEAKLGELIDKETNQRYYIPARSECVLADSARIGFRSSMTEHRHKKLNEFLNDLVTKSQTNGSNTQSRVKIDYCHRRETDKFYELPKAMQSNLPGLIRERIPSHHTPKVRVTYDQKTGAALAKIIKVRVSDLDIHGGILSAIDCRISINLEMPYDGDLDELIEFGGRANQSPNRSKDRLSYTQSYYQIDLTQITIDNRTDKEHELEMEISTDAIMNQGRLAASSQANEYLPLVEGFLNNVRVLSRFVAEIK